MNIFLIRSSPDASARAFLAADPVRARKQLLECCQILASVDHLLLGSTAMLKADGTPYRLAHQRHPITKRCAAQYDQWELCCDVAIALAVVIPSHACAKSVQAWCESPSGHNPMPLASDDRRLIVCRKGQPQALVNDRDEYAAIMSEYLDHKHTLDASRG